MSSKAPAGSTNDQAADQRRAASIKTWGYAISTLSVVLLGIVSWKKAAEEPLLMACLLIGMASSVAGMFLRWLSYEIEKRSKRSG